MKNNAQTLRTMLGAKRNTSLNNDEIEALEASIAALAQQAGAFRNETMVELFPGLPKLPQWLFDYAREVSKYMAANHPGQWAIDEIESRGFIASSGPGGGGEVA